MLTTRYFHGILQCQDAMLVRQRVQNFQRFGNSDTFDIRLVSIFNLRNCCTIFKAKKVAWGFIIISSNWGAIIQWFGFESSMVDLLVLNVGNGWEWGLL